jgi:hypothetical protein
MRHWMLLLLGVTACGKSSETTPPARGMTAAEKAAVEDTVWKLNVYSMQAQSRRDLKALMQLMPDTGALAITDGSMITDMDSLEAGVKQFWGLPFLSGLKVNWEKKRIDVLSPDAAVLITEGSTLSSTRRETAVHDATPLDRAVAESRWPLGGCPATCVNHSRRHGEIGGRYAEVDDSRTGTGGLRWA